MKIAFLLVTHPLDVKWYAPLSFGYLKSYAEKVWDHPIDFFAITEEELLTKEFDLLALSSTSQDFGKCCKLLNRFRQVNPYCPVVMGGHHITYLPETLPREVDVGVMGEGEETFAEIVSVLSCGEGTLCPKHLRDIPGIVYRENGRIVRNPRRPKRENLDDLPHPYRDSKEMPYLFSSRGCPYKCSFCISSAFWGRIRYFSAEYVVDEIEGILEQLGDKVSHLTFMDDLMTVNRNRLRRMATLLVDRGSNERVTFSMAVRAGLVDDEICQILKSMNVSDVFFGAESGVDRILRFLKNGTQTVAQNQATLDILAGYQIPVSLSFIVGVPGETEDDFRQTYEFIIRNLNDNKIFAASVNILMPIPGTLVWDQAIRMGLFNLQNIEWERLSCFASHKNSTINNVSEWVKTRREIRSYYMNEEGIPHERLLLLLEEYETMIEEMKKQKAV
jgi:anaerobic magnesium-protoporphyrin IX monomethyl ester cyclase